MFVRAIACLVFLTTIWSSALGQNFDSSPSSGQIIERLKELGTGLPRGLSIESVEPIRKDEQDTGRMDLYVSFGFNSARLTTDGEILLDTLANALNDSQLVQFRFEIAGHTDGVGSDKYNLRLSQERASVVRNYLILRGKVDGARLVAKGYGKTLLRNKSDPGNAENRRVEIINLVSNRLGV